MAAAQGQPHLPSLLKTGACGSLRKVMTPRLLAVLCLAIAWVLPTATPARSDLTSRTAVRPWPVVITQAVAEGFHRPVHITHAGDGTHRLFVVEQAGRVRILKNGILLPDSFLDIGARVSCCGERGLLSIAFPPDFAGKQYFYINYTDLGGDTVVARYRVQPGQPNTADPESEEVILRVEQPYSSHNGGQLAFGPDGYLYIGLGDGGGAGDPHDLAQHPATLLGKLLRLDTESGVRPYAIPITNPFTATAGYRGEIWALGLRNPWRFSFDRATGDLYIADVGQNRREEINVQPASGPGGENYGWRVMEGSLCYWPSSCDPTGLVLPVAEYDHSLGCAVTGGFVARAGDEPTLQGIYLFGDFCSGRLWGLRRHGEEGWQQALLLDTDFTISTFGEDEMGHLYLADYSRGRVYRLGALHSLWLPRLRL